MTTTMPDVQNNIVLRMQQLPVDALDPILSAYGLSLVWQQANESIIGSYWGDEEAGLVGNELYVRPDTPVHSVLHEACHYICMDEERRSLLHTDAGGDYDEENAVCYLQILLAGKLQSMGFGRMFADMDCWGYTFRLGSAERWFREDAQDAQHWLERQKLVIRVDAMHWLLLSTLGLVVDAPDVHCQ